MIFTELKHQEIKNRTQTDIDKILLCYFFTKKMIIFYNCVEYPMKNQI